MEWTLPLGEKFISSFGERITDALKERARKDAAEFERTIAVFEAVDKDMWN